jgi:ATP-binding cassette subfamily B (MDR/TAP) protein 1
MLFIGFLSAIITGLMMPSLAIIMGEVISTFDPGNGSSISDIMKQLLGTVLAIAAILWFNGYVYFAFFQQLAEIIAIDLRGKYLRSLMVQEVAFFELNNVEAMPSDIGQYFNTISQGIGESYAALIQSFGVFVGGFGIAFYKGVAYTLMCMAYIPLLLIVFMFFGSFTRRAQSLKLQAN